jgi:hypothetical protein
MTTAIIIGRKHGNKALRIASGPLDPSAQNAKFKELAKANGGDSGWSEIYLHEIVLSAGRKQKHFRPPQK